MVGEWRETTIESIATHIAMGPFGSDIKTDNFVPSGVPVIRGNNLTRGRFRGDEFVFLTEEKADELANANAFPGDLVFTHRGTLGQVGLIPASPFARYVVSQSQMKLTCDPDSADALFIYYFFTSPIGQHALLMNTSQTGVPAISRPVTSLKAVQLALPPLPEQRAIAHILGTLDDKIELNRWMNETLEAMAMALFKSWFMDFDPVRAKAEGRDPGLPQPLADLFPDSFDDSGLGEIPKGWSAAPLPDVIEVNPTRQLKKGDVAPYLDMANMPTRGHTPDEVVERPFGSGMRFKNGDTLVARITPCLENGKTAYVDFLEDEQVGWGSTEYIVLRTKAPLPSEFAYCLARSSEFREFAIQSMTGSSGRQRVPAESLSHFLVVTPDKELAARFGQAVGPLFLRASNAARESRALASLRDTLLPKLICGELRLEDPVWFLRGGD
jgi:type I restriction enzyme, S subunit